MMDYIDNITFHYELQDGDKTDHEINLSYSYPDGMSVSEFHRACKRFGYALGFAQDTIEKYFGEDTWEEI